MCKVLVFSFVMLQIISGCTAIGLGVGVYLDSRTEAVIINPLHDLDTIEEGEQITVTLKGGYEYQGEYDGLGVVDDDEYRVSYEKFRRNITDGLQLPAIGDMITIYLKPARDSVNKERVFLGFNFKASPDGRKTYLKYKYKLSNETELMNLRRIHSIVKPGEYEINPQTIDDFIVSGGLTDVMAINLRNNAGDNKIAVKDIDYITLKSERNMTKILGAVGFVSDLIIYMIIKPPSEETGTPAGGG